MINQDTTQEPSQDINFKIESKFLLSIVKNINSFVDEFKFKFNNEGLKINEFDSGNVCLIDISINKNLFLEYKQNIQEDLIFKINTKQLYNSLKDNKKDNVVLNFDNENLRLIFDNGFNTKISLLDYKEDNIREFPKLEFNNNVKISSKRFKEIIKNLKNSFETVLIEIDTDTKQLIFKSKNELNESNIVLNDDEILIDNNRYPTKSKYSLEYLNHFVKNLITENLILKYNNDYPLLITQETELFRLNFILAPRVEN